MAKLLEFDEVSPSKRRRRGSGKEGGVPIPSTTAAPGQGRVSLTDDLVINNMAQASPALGGVGMPETRTLLTRTDLQLEPIAGNLPRLFCPKLCDAVVKANGYAKVSMGRGERSGEVLRIEIYRDCVPALAANLFGIALQDVQMQHWRLDWENGTVADVRGTAVRLCRTNEDAIARHMGESLLGRIRKSSARSREVENGEELTRLVSLEISGHKDSSAFLEVDCDVELSRELKDVLWYNSMPDQL